MRSKKVVAYYDWTAEQIMWNEQQLATIVVGGKSTTPAELDTWMEQDWAQRRRSFRS